MAGGRLLARFVPGPAVYRSRAVLSHLPTVVHPRYRCIAALFLLDKQCYRRFAGDALVPYDLLCPIVFCRRAPLALWLKGGSVPGLRYGLKLSMRYLRV